jgi:hypothetical protein
MRSHLRERIVPATGSPCERSVQLMLSKELDQASRADTDKAAR